MLGLLSLFLNILEADSIEVDKTVTISKAKEFEKKKDGFRFPTYGMMLGDQFLAEQRMMDIHRQARLFAPELVWLRNDDNSVLIPVNFTTNADPIKDEELKSIGWVFDHIGRNTNWMIRFTQYKNETHFINYGKDGASDSCYTQHWFINNILDEKKEYTKIVVNLGINCWDYRIVLHETMHALGFHHEQNRYDRDNSLTIQWKNIQRDWIPQYYKKSRYGITSTDPECMNINKTYPDKNQVDEWLESGFFDDCTQGESSTVCGLDYDKYSIMHYSNPDPNCKKPECAAMVLRHPGPNGDPLDYGYFSMNRKDGLTELDIEKLHCAYRLGRYANFSKDDIEKEWKKPMNE